MPFLPDERFEVMFRQIELQRSSSSWPSSSIVMFAMVMIVVGE